MTPYLAYLLVPDQVSPGRHEVGKALGRHELVDLVRSGRVEEEPLRERVEPALRPQVEAHREAALPAQHLSYPVRLAQPLPHLCRGGVPPLVLALHQQQVGTLLVGRRNAPHLVLGDHDRLDAQRMQPQPKALGYQRGVGLCGRVYQAHLGGVPPQRLGDRPVDAPGKHLGGAPAERPDALPPALDIDVHASHRVQAAALHDRLQPGAAEPLAPNVNGGNGHGSPRDTPAL